MAMTDARSGGSISDDVLTIAGVNAARVMSSALERKGTSALSGCCGRVRSPMSTPDAFAHRIIHGISPWPSSWLVAKARNRPFWALGNCGKGGKRVGF